MPYDPYAYQKRDYPLAFPDGYKSTDPSPFETWEEFCAHFEENDPITVMLDRQVGDGYLSDTKVPVLLQWKYISKSARKRHEMLGMRVQGRIVKLHPKRRVCTIALVAKGPVKGNLHLPSIPRSIREGDVREGFVARAAEFGFIVVIDEFCCWLNTKDVAWSKVLEPNAPPIMGRTVKVLVQRVQHEKNRVYVSLKHCLKNPYLDLDKNFKKDEWYDGTVTHLDELGVFVQIAPGIVGLGRPEHIQGLGHDEYAEDYFHPGDQVRARIHWMNPDQQKVGLNLTVEEPNPFRESLGDIKPAKLTRGIIKEVSKDHAIVEVGKGALARLADTEISWSRQPDDLRKELSVGDEIECRVSRLDLVNEVLEVSIRQVIPDPWKSGDELHEVGSIEGALVLKSEKKFVRVLLESGIEGEVASKNFTKAWKAEPPEVDSLVEVEITGLNAEERSITLKPA